MRLEIEQNTEEWFAARSGKFTGSPAGLFIVKGKGAGNLGAGLLTRIDEIVTERLTIPDTGEYIDPRQWGHDYEQEALDVYEDTVGFVRVAPGGFHTTGEYTGCSPDGEIDNSKGIAEVKCPANSVNHYITISTGEVPKKHLPQIVWNMRESGTGYCDFISYDPRFILPEHRIFIKRVYLKDHRDIEEVFDKKTKIAIELVEEKLKLMEVK